MSFTVNAKIVNRGFLCTASESSCSKLQDDPSLTSVACSYAELSISAKIGR